MASLVLDTLLDSILVRVCPVVLGSGIKEESLIRFSLVFGRALMLGQFLALYGGFRAITAYGFNERYHGGRKAFLWGLALVGVGMLSIFLGACAYTQG